MIRRPLKLLSHIAAACLLIAFGIVAFECILLNREVAVREQVDAPDSGIGVSIRSWSVHHCLRPGAVVEHPLATGETNRIALNSFGLRGPEPLVPKPTDVYRILMLGDGTVFAPDLPESQSVTFQLEHLLQQTTSHRVELINAAVPGYCPLLSLLQFRHHLAGLNPDLIVLHYDMSDVADDRRYRSTLRSDRNGLCLSCSHPALLGGTGQKAPGYVRKFAIGRWLVSQFCEARLERDDCVDRYAWLRPEGDDSRTASVNSSLEPLVELAGMARQLSVRFVLTSTPIASELLGEPSVEGSVDSSWQFPHRLLTQFAKRHGIEFCDVSASFSSSTRGGLVRKSGLSPEGHRALSVELAAHILGKSARRPSEPGRVQQVSAGG